MKKKRIRILAFITMIALLVLSACNSDDSSSGSDKTKEDYDFLSILTGGTQGTYYALGGALADTISQETGIKTTAEVSQASAANMTALQDGNGDIAFVQTDIAYYASKGEHMFDGEIINSVSAIGALYPETIQIVTLEKSGIKSVEDLKGKTVSFGARFRNTCKRGTNFGNIRFDNR